MRLFKVIAVAVVLLALVSASRAAFGQSASPEATSLLPQKIGKFSQARKLAPSTLFDESAMDASSLPAPTSSEMAEYVGSNGRAIVQILRYRQDAEAYSILSALAHNVYRAELGTNVGTSGFVAHDETAFFKGPIFVRITNVKGNAASELAQNLSDALDKGEGDIPVLIKHLPNADEARKTALFVPAVKDIKALSTAPVLSAVETGGNADVAVATYGSAKLLLVEFNTPQLSVDNDRRIVTRIQELWKLGQPAPTAYRRVGNYSVFVFDAPDEQTAKQLIDQVKYEQVVQWLGENPNILKDAEKRYINTTLGVLIAVLKASGYAALTCLGLGGLFGGLLFSYRRAQQRQVTAYSDAGGMLRLNLDELSAKTEPQIVADKR